MKIGRFIIVFVPLCLVFCFCIEAAAVRPPLKPLDMNNLHRMVSDADVIAVGTVGSETRSKTLQRPRETIVIRAIMNVDKILKGDKSIKTITIEESYRQFSSDDSLVEKNITASTAGPTPPVGIYHEGERILVFLKNINKNGSFRPLGSGDHDAYLGLMRITSDGVKPDRYMLDDSVSKYAGDEDNFISLIARIALHSSTGQ